LAGTAGARTQTASGDTCGAAGNGTSYTLHIKVSPGAQQFGFAFRAPGTKIMNAVIPGVNGNFSATQGVAVSASGAWTSDAPLTGTPVVTLTTTSAVNGHFTVVPLGASQTPAFDPVACTLSIGAGLPSVSFSVNGHTTYVAHLALWHMAVTVPTGGTVSAQQLLPTIGTASAKSVTAKAAVQVRRVVSRHGGKVTLALKPTSSGQARLAANGSLTVRLRVVFDADNGKASDKLVSVTLKK
jgi:hypothetical protein